MKNTFPAEQGWVRLKHEVSSDLLFNNPIERALNDTIWNENDALEKKLKNKTDKYEIKQITNL